MKVKIYTRTGDKGTTSLYGGVRVPKYNLRVMAYGTVDELNSTVGVVAAFLEENELRTFLYSIQSDLLHIGSSLAGKKGLLLQLSQRVKDLEKTIDQMDTKLPELHNFIVPGGDRVASLAHVARSVTRRAEREVNALSESEKVDKEILKYLNRLSDFFFELARFINHSKGVKDIVWKTEKKEA